MPDDKQPYESIDAFIENTVGTKVRDRADAERLKALFSVSAAQLEELTDSQLLTFQEVVKIKESRMQIHAMIDRACRRGSLEPK